MSAYLFIGRFQPFHQGHLWAVEQGLAKAGQVIIGIGSSQYSHSFRNPFSAPERQRMIEKSLAEKGVSSERYRIVLIPDLHNEKEWPHYVARLIQNFDCLLVGEGGGVERLFTQAMPTLPILKISRRSGISGTHVRKALLQKKGWQEQVPSGTRSILKEIRAEERLKAVQGKSDQASK